jgi:hypothetical protein
MTAQTLSNLDNPQLRPPKRWVQRAVGHQSAIRARTVLFRGNDGTQSHRHTDTRTEGQFPMKHFHFPFLPPEPNIKGLNVGKAKEQQFLDDERFSFCLKNPNIFCVFLPQDFLESEDFKAKRSVQQARVLRRSSDHQSSLRGLRVEAFLWTCNFVEISGDGCLLEVCKVAARSRRGFIGRTVCWPRNKIWYFFPGRGLCIHRGRSSTCISQSSSRSVRGQQTRVFVFNEERKKYFKRRPLSQCGPPPDERVRISISASSARSCEKPPSIGLADQTVRYIERHARPARLLALVSAQTGLRHCLLKGSLSC